MKQYEVQNIISNTINKEYIKIGVGLNQVDNLAPSAYFYEALEKSKTYQELERKITKYYQDVKKEQINIEERECDIVSQHIAHILESKGFSFLQFI